MRTSNDPRAHNSAEIQEVLNVHQRNDGTFSLTGLLTPRRLELLEVGLQQLRFEGQAIMASVGGIWGAAGLSGSFVCGFQWRGKEVRLEIRGQCNGYRDSAELGLMEGMSEVRFLDLSSVDLIPPAVVEEGNWPSD